MEDKGPDEEWGEQTMLESLRELLSNAAEAWMEAFERIPSGDLLSGVPPRHLFVAGSTLLALAEDFRSKGETERADGLSIIGSYLAGRMAQGIIRDQPDPGMTALWIKALDESQVIGPQVAALLNDHGFPPSPALLVALLNLTMGSAFERKPPIRRMQFFALANDLWNAWEGSRPRGGK